MNKIPEWLPDWTDEAQYPDHNDLQVWAWEFLRRNIEYQLDWDLARRHWDKWVFNDDISDVRERSAFSEGDKVSRPVPGQLAIKWGLELKIVDPSISDPFPPPFFKNPIPLEVPYPGKGIPESPTECGLIFDLELPIDSQLEWAKRSLTRIQCELIREGKIKPVEKLYRPRMLRSYLRVYDSILAGVQPKEAAANLFPFVPNLDGSKSRSPRYRDHKNSAIDLVENRGYQRLLLAIKPPDFMRD